MEACAKIALDYKDKIKEPQDWFIATDIAAMINALPSSPAQDDAGLVEAAERLLAKAPMYEGHDTVTVHQQLMRDLQAALSTHAAQEGALDAYTLARVVEWLDNAPDDWPFRGSDIATSIRMGMPDWERFAPKEPSNPPVNETEIS